MEFFIQLGFSVKNLKHNISGNCITSASKSGGAKLINYLINQGAEVNTRDQNSATPLLKAIHYENVEAVEALIKADANTNKATEVSSLTYLELAFNKENIAIIKFNIR